MLATVIENSLTTSVSVRGANGGHAVSIDIADEGEAWSTSHRVFERHVPAMSQFAGLALAKDLVEADGRTVVGSPAVISIPLNAVPKSLDPTTSCCRARRSRPCQNV